MQRNYGNIYTDMQKWEKAMKEKITQAKMHSIKNLFSPIKLIVLKNKLKNTCLSFYYTLKS